MERERYKKRNQEIRTRRAGGEKLSDIAVDYGISIERVRQIAMKPEDTEPKDEVWCTLKAVAERMGYEGVLRRTYNSLKRGHMASSLTRVPFESLPRERWHEMSGIGKKSLELLYEAFPK